MYRFMFHKPINITLFHSVVTSLGYACLLYMNLEYLNVLYNIYMYMHMYIYMYIF